MFFSFYAERWRNVTLVKKKNQRKKKALSLQKKTFRSLKLNTLDKQYYKHCYLYKDKMLNSDREKGKALLITASVLFLYYTLWVIGSPFIDDSRLKSMFYSNNIALMVAAISGLCFVGGLTIFTFYHIRPYLNKVKDKKEWSREFCVKDYFNKWYLTILLYILNFCICTWSTGLHYGKYMCTNWNLSSCYIIQR